MHSFLSSGRVDTAVWMHYIDANKTYRENLTATTQCCKQYWSPGDSTPRSSSSTDTYHPSRKLSKLGEPDMRDTTVNMDEQRQDVQLEPTYNSSVLIQDVFLKTCQKQWTIEKGVEKGVRDIRADGPIWCRRVFITTVKSEVLLPRPFPETGNVTI